MNLKKCLPLSALVCSLLTLCAASFAQENPSQAGVTTHSTRAVKFDISAPLSEMIKSQPISPFQEKENSAVRRPKAALHTTANGLSAKAANVGVQNAALYPTTATVGVNVLGLGVGFTGFTVAGAPPDPNLAVGDTQVVQWVNSSFAIFDKTTGAKIAGPFAGNTLWAGFGGQCQTRNSGDPVAQWDKIAHRWVLMQPVFTAPYFSCIAVSTTPDATGTYYRFAFPQINGFPDYPKLGNWIDAYYTTQNIFNNAGTAYLGVEPCAFEKTKLLVGDSTAKMICVFDTSNGTLFDDGFLPADIDSPELLPPAGTPEVFLGSIDNFSSDTHVYKYTMKPDFVNSTAVFTGTNGAAPITVNAFTGACNFGNACIPQQGTSTLLDSLGDRLMYRLAFRRTVNRANVPVNQYLVSHSIGLGTSGGVPIAERWYEFRAPNSDVSALSLYQQGTYSPNSTNRWMGSLALDKDGNIILGYSTSSSTVFPSINFASRASTDPLGTLGTESLLWAGTGSQRATSNRWGDYTSMAIDNDGCTMWYTDEYYVTPNVTFAWATRVASLKVPTCTPWNPVP
jgi:hypothetical protein